MKHRFLSLFLVLALLLSMMVMPATALETETNVTQTSETCPCGCGSALDAVVWRAWDSDANGITSGHYYLEDDYIQNGQKVLVK